ncbi:glycosyl transferase family 2 [Spirosoma montaniterrae]|uniref:Glycosyl transferase family 2 n=1 Tax=Spirosoma montaniterrae TaxID=1178516 RepID=A0A1P9X444_9BACT|nr:glycosyl transferase family 2 [Spirosoma montaniterrae]
MVPVRNEAHHLAQTLDALRQQANPDGLLLHPACFEVLLLANNCTDDSYEIAVRYQQRFPDFRLHVAQIQLPPQHANIGTVRRMLMDEAHRRLTNLGKRNGIIASTDGDTVVDKLWLHHIVREISAGSDAVGGRILTQPDKSHVRLFHLRDVTYRTLIARAESLFDPCPHDPWPRHFQHFGASIAVTCQTYERVGGLPVKPFLEDEAFYRALIRMDAKVRQSPHVKVFTSTRIQGRVAVGFSEQLRCWSDMSRVGQCQLAEPADAVLARLNARRQLRLCWSAQTVSLNDIEPIAQTLHIDPLWLASEISKYRYFGELWENIEEKMTSGLWSQRWQPVPIVDAIRELRKLIRQSVPANEPFAIQDPADNYLCAG